MIALMEHSASLWASLQEKGPRGRRELVQTFSYLKKMGNVKVRDKIKDSKKLKRTVKNCFEECINDLPKIGMGVDHRCKLAPRMGSNQFEQKGKFLANWSDGSIVKWSGKQEEVVQDTENLVGAHGEPHQEQ